MAPPTNRIVGVIAPKGSGKSYSVAQAIRGAKRVAVFDMLADSIYLSSVDEVVIGRPREFARLISTDEFRICYRPTQFNLDGDDVFCPEFEMFAWACYLRGNMIMVVDEAHLLCTSRACPQPLYFAATLGRHRGLSLYYIAQRFSQVSRILTTNTDEFWLWRIIEPGDIEGIAKRCGREVAERVSELRATSVVDGQVIPGEMLRWSKD